MTVVIAIATSINGSTTDMAITQEGVPELLLSFLRYEASLCTATSEGRRGRGRERERGEEESEGGREREGEGEGEREGGV